MKDKPIYRKLSKVPYSLIPFDFDANHWIIGGFLFCVCFFAVACGISPQPGIKPEHRVLTTGPPGNSLDYWLYWSIIMVYSFFKNGSGKVAQKRLLGYWDLALLEVQMEGECQLMTLLRKQFLVGFEDLKSFYFWVFLDCCFMSLSSKKVSQDTHNYFVPRWFFQCCVSEW